MPDPTKKSTNIQQELFEGRRSPLRTYQEVAVGRRSFFALLSYELAHTFLSGFPGALGLVLRRILYRRWLGKVGRNVTFGRNITFRHPHKIRIGDNVAIDDHCLLDAKGADNQGIEIGSHVVIGRYCVLHCKNGDIRLGDYVNMGMFCSVASSCHVEIQDKTLMAAYAYIVGGDHDYSDADLPPMEQQRIARGIRVGAESWIGAHAVVLDGTDIGPGTIVGAGSVVTKSLPAGVIAAGTPARVIRVRKNQEASAGGAERLET